MFSKITFLKSVRSNEKDEVCHSFVVEFSLILSTEEVCPAQTVFYPDRGQKQTFLTPFPLILSTQLLNGPLQHLETLNQTPIPSLRNFVTEKVRHQKTNPTMLSKLLKQFFRFPTFLLATFLREGVRVQKKYLLETIWLYRVL